MYQQQNMKNRNTALNINIIKVSRRKPYKKCGRHPQNHKTLSREISKDDPKMEIHITTMNCKTHYYNDVISSQLHS